MTLQDFQSLAPRERDELCAKAEGLEQVPPQNIQGLAGWWPKVTGRGIRWGEYSPSPPDYGEPIHYERLIKKAQEKAPGGFEDAICDILNPEGDEIEEVTSDLWRVSKAFLRRLANASTMARLYTAIKTLEAG